MSLPTSTKAWILTNKPTDTAPTTTGPNPSFTLQTRPLPPLTDNQVLVKTLSLSNDPAQRTWISGVYPASRMYMPPVELNDVMAATAVSEVLASTSAEYKPGDHIVGFSGWSEYAILDAATIRPASPLPKGLSERHYLGAFGLTGLTAYFGLVKVGGFKKGERLVVSGAAGATGSVVVQIAKKILGASSVVGIAGGEEKCRWVEGLGADVCLNYKSPTFYDDLKAATKDGVDVYFDNIGGELLDNMFNLVSVHARIVACGFISGYNGEQVTTFRNWWNVTFMKLEVKGFIVLQFMEQYPEAIKFLTEAVEEGKLVIDDKSETIIEGGVEDIPAIWAKIFEGVNTGKLVTVLR
ncbi:hypothetical protein BJY04DRAFT_28070 [Aspergillus karnatakaensis]|uniref:MDR family NADP-dependent oxidoreductase n=1 Tax=Aspergillus karnatakaensis TaxID=1810916 RepID=UPI003CCDBDFC